MTRKKKAATAPLLDLFERHIAIFERLGMRIDRQSILTDDCPGVTFVGGLIWVRSEDAAQRIRLHAPTMQRYRNAQPDRNGNVYARYDLKETVAWQRHDGRLIRLLNADGSLRVRPATMVRMCYPDGQSRLPIEVPMDCVVAWDYQNGEPVEGRALPFDIDLAIARGWFSEEGAHPLGMNMELALLPVERNHRNGRMKVVHGFCLHLTGKAMNCRLPVDWSKAKVPCFVIEQVDDFRVIPIAQIALPEGREEAGLEGVEEKSPLGPEEFDCGVYRGNVWAFLHPHGIRPFMTGQELQDAKKRIVHQRHPDKLERALKDSLEEGELEIRLNEASVQFAFVKAALERVFAIREAQWRGVRDRIGEDIPEQFADSRSAKGFRGLKEGSDVLTEAISAELGVAFDWSNGYHTSLRERMCDHLVRRAVALAKAARDEEEDAQGEEPAASTEGAPVETPEQGEEPAASTPGESSGESETTSA